MKLMVTWMTMVTMIWISYELSMVDVTILYFSQGPNSTDLDLPGSFMPFIV